TTASRTQRLSRRVFEGKLAPWQPPLASPQDFCASSPVCSIWLPTPIMLLIAYPGRLFPGAETGEALVAARLPGPVGGSQNRHRASGGVLGRWPRVAPRDRVGPAGD